MSMIHQWCNTSGVSPVVDNEELKKREIGLIARIGELGVVGVEGVEDECSGEYRLKNDK